MNGVFMCHFGANYAFCCVFSDNHDIISMKLYDIGIVYDEVRENFAYFLLSDS